MYSFTSDEGRAAVMNQRALDRAELERLTQRISLKRSLMHPLLTTAVKSGVVLVALLLLHIPAVAQNANFGKLTLDSNKTSGTLQGSTGGSTSLPAIVSNSDRSNNKCLGFGDPTPDHILVLQQAVPRLRLRVNSGGGDTTLVVQGPNGVIRCGDDSSRSKDASITDTDWQAGTYRIWVGSATPSTPRDYTLSVRP